MTGENHTRYNWLKNDDTSILDCTSSKENAFAYKQSEKLCNLCLIIFLKVVSYEITNWKIYYIKLREKLKIIKYTIWKFQTKSLMNVFL